MRESSDEDVWFSMFVGLCVAKKVCLNDYRLTRSDIGLFSLEIQSFTRNSVSPTWL